MGYVTCILYVKRKFKLIIFLTWVDLFPLFPKPTWIIHELGLIGGKKIE